MINLYDYDHEVFHFLYPTNQRINRSVAWLAECKVCDKRQLVSASRIMNRQTTTCIYCKAEANIKNRGEHGDKL